MRLDDERESSNTEDQRGGGGFGGGGSPFGIGGGGGGGLGGLIGLIFAARGLGLGGIAVVVVLFLIFGGGLGGLGGLVGGGSPQQQAGFQPGEPAPASPAQAATDSFVKKVLASTEDSWSAVFKASGQDYPEPTLVFYSGTGQSGCGVAQSAVGPFYCPSDRKIYLDTSFFDELSRRFGAPGDFAAAYVIAHEVGHHIQAVTGQMDRARRMGGREEGADGQQVRIELQADCYAGVWGATNKALLDTGDIDEALKAANAIGDDTLQTQAGGRIRPDAFTHGSSAQRMAWFKRGYDTGDPAQCDTFAGVGL